MLTIIKKNAVSLPHNTFLALYKSRVIDFVGMPPRLMFCRAERLPYDVPHRKTSPEPRERDAFCGCDDPLRRLGRTGGTPRAPALSFPNDNRPPV
ncbi:hypothetical protein JW805_15855 [Roseomonas aeriglobus]|nr:hypothetical protein [Roseomonas aeriglobus]